jgi:hyaluronoglucosaminidase
MSPTGLMNRIGTLAGPPQLGIEGARLRAARPIPVGQAPDALAVTPDSKTVLAVGGDSDSVTPISAGAAPGADGRRFAQARAAVPVGYSPAAIELAPSGSTAVVVDTYAVAIAH